MPRRPHDLLGDAAELRPDLLSDVGTIAVEIQASEDVPAVVEQQRRLVVVEQQIGEQTGCRALRGRVAS